MAATTLTELRELIRDLTPQDKLALIEELVQQLRPSFPRPDKPPHRSLHGMLAHLGPGPTDEEITEARREAWQRFPNDTGYGDLPALETATKEGQSTG